MTRAIGIDISRYDLSFDPNRASGAIDFAIQKATEGTTYVDLSYDDLWQGVQRITVRGAYHYQRSGYSWLAQADHFLTTAAKHDYHLYALDLENYSNTYNDTFFADTKRIIDRWRAVSDKKVVLYTNGDTYNQLYLALLKLYGEAGAAWLDEVLLWIASPGIAGAPVLPKYRTNQDWHFHQFSWNGLASRWGTGRDETDENVFNGDVNKLWSWLRMSGATEAPQEGTNTMQGRIKTLTNIRLSNNKGSADMGDLLAGDIVTWDTEVSGTDGLIWCKLISATRDGLPVLCTDKTPVTGRYCWANNVEEIVTPVETFPPRVGLTFDGSVIKWYVPE